MTFGLSVLNLWPLDKGNKIDSFENSGNYYLKLHFPKNI